MPWITIIPLLAELLGAISSGLGLSAKVLSEASSTGAKLTKAAEKAKTAAGAIKTIGGITSTLSAIAGSDDPGSKSAVKIMGANISARAVPSSKEAKELKFLTDNPEHAEGFITSTTTVQIELLAQVMLYKTLTISPSKSARRLTYISATQEKIVLLHALQNHLLDLGAITAERMSTFEGTKLEAVKIPVPQGLNQKQFDILFSYLHSDREMIVPHFSKPALELQAEYSTSSDQQASRPRIRLSALSLFLHHGDQLPSGRENIITSALHSFGCSSFSLAGNLKGYPLSNYTTELYQALTSMGASILTSANIDSIVDWVEARIVEKKGGGAKIDLHDLKVALFQIAVLEQRGWMTLAALRMRQPFSWEPDWNITGRSPGDTAFDLIMTAPSNFRTASTAVGIPNYSQKWLSEARKPK